MNAKEVLERARELIEAGWNKHANTDGHGRYCLKAALGLASGRYRDFGSTVGFDRLPPNADVEQFRKKYEIEKLDSMVCRIVTENLPEGFDSISVFNDDPRTSQYDVLCAIDKAMASC